MLKIIFFDFDGVIVESAGIKTNAFRKLFSSYSSHVDEIVNYHKKNAGVSRYDKFDYIFENILGEKLTEDKKAELGKKFSELVLEEIIICPFVSGAIDFLEKYYKKLKLVVASATPDEELKYLVGKRGLEKYFLEIHGAPAKKSEIILRVIENDNVDKEDALFIGDTTSDYNHAKEAGVPFVGRITESENPFPKDVKKIRDFNELDNLVEALI